MATATVGSKWRPKLPRALATVIGGSSMTAASVWRLRSRRGVSVGRVSFYGSMGTWRGRPGLKAGLWVPMWPVGAPRRPRRHGDDSEARGCTTGLRWGSHGVVAGVRVGACVPRGRRRPWPTRSRCGAPWPAWHGPVASRGMTGGSPLVSTAIGWRCSGGSRPCSSGSRAVQCRLLRLR